MDPASFVQLSAPVTVLRTPTPPIITHSKVQFYFTNVGEWISDIMRYAIRDLVISRF
jgi:hypothetical protein